MNKQSRKMSMVETAANVLGGGIISWSVTLWILPLWGYQYSARESFEITMVFFVISTIRLYAFRRFFERLKKGGE